ncbi:MAG TPA: hypothetical protein VGH14_01550 [Solirubrobacterales bacterium]|jgi:hypothetical protein
MSTTQTRRSERDAVVIGELDEVALLEAVDGWRIGTTGTVVEVSSGVGTIEIPGYLGESLDFLDVPTKRLRLVQKCLHPDPDFARRRAEEGADKRNRPLPIGELDVVALRTAIDGWPAGTRGTVISQGPSYKEVEVSNHLGEDLAFLVVSPDQLRVVWRAARRDHKIDVD